MQPYVKFLVRFRYGIVLLWLLAAVFSVLCLPSLGTVVAHHSTSFLPDSNEVVQAQKLIDQIDPEHKSKSSAVVAVHNVHGLTLADKQYFHTVLGDIDAHRSQYHIAQVQSAANTDASVASAFVSKDGTTEIALVDFPEDVVSQRTADALTQVRHAFDHAPADTKVYFTGEVPIQQDDIQISQQGAAKTAIVTVVLVLAILLLVFRSVVAPFITLAAIGLSFVVTSGLVAWLAQYGLPVSTFTQTFLIAILFGAGTDYSIIILNRYREELIRGHGKHEAIEAALRAVSKTVIFSGLTVLVSFAVLFLANFGLYRSAAGVSLGILIVLATCLVFIPALMAVLGGHLFWPRKPAAGMAHATSRVWRNTALLSTRRPWWALLVLTVVLVPIALLFTDQRTFDPMADIPGSSAVNGFHTVADAFGPGHAMPMNIVLQTDSDLRTPQGLTTIENISHAIAAQPSVAGVNSATRPAGTVINAFQLTEQNAQAAAGLDKVHQGLNTLSSKLSQAGASGSTNKMNQLVQGAEQLTSATYELQHGLSSLRQNTGKLSDGTAQVQAGAGQLAGSLASLSTSLGQTQSGAHQLAQGLGQTAAAADTLADGTAQLSQSQQQLSSAGSELANLLAAWAATHPNEAADPNWQQIIALAQAQQTGLAQSAAAGKQLADGAQQLAGALPGLNQGAASLDAGLTQLTGGSKQAATGANQLAFAAGQVAQGTAALNGGTSKLSNGAGQLASGSHQLTSGIQTLSSSLAQLGQAGDGVAKLDVGVQQTQNFLRQSGEAGTAGSPGFHVPASAVSSNAGLAKAMNAYISPDGHVANFTVILNANPYSMQAISDVPAIQQVAQSALTTSPIHVGKILSAGTTPVQAALNSVSSQDFVRTMAIILIAIFLLLMVMLRSVIAPAYIILSLAATYFVTMGILQEVAIHLLHQPGLSWAVPFFVFLLLVALGVDYSIFLMARFDEEQKRGLTPPEAIATAMSRMGNVIFSAAMIMAGTFGSMMATGMTTMVEIGLAVIIGLALYAIVLLAFFVPACVTVVGIGHSWPFVRKEQAVKQKLTAEQSIAR